MKLIVTGSKGDIDKALRLLEDVFEVTRDITFEVYDEDVPEPLEASGVPGGWPADPNLLPAQ